MTTVKIQGQFGSTVGLGSLYIWFLQQQDNHGVIHQWPADTAGEYHSA